MQAVTPIEHNLEAVNTTCSDKNLARKGPYHGQSDKIILNSAISNNEEPSV